MKNWNTEYFIKSALALIMYFSLTTFSQTPDWTKVIKYVGPNSDELLDMTKDNNDNIYILGIYQDSIKIDTATLYSDANYSDMFVAKLNSDYEVQWAACTNNDDGIGPHNIRVDTSGNVYVAGTFSSAIKFGNISLTKYDASVFIAKLNKNGIWQWAEDGYYSNSTVYYGGMEIDSDGNAYLGGYYIFGAHFGSYTLYNTGHTNAYAAKIYSDGHWAWAKQGVKVNGQAYGYLVKNTDNSFYLDVYFAGPFADKLVFGTDTLYEYGNYLVSLYPNGDFGKFINFPNQSSMRVLGNDNFLLTTQAGSDSVVVGDTTYYSTYKTGDVVLAKVTNDSVVGWSYQFTCSSTLYSGRIATDTLGNIYMASTFEDTLHFNNEDVVAKDFRDIYVIKISKDGKPQWVRTAGGTGYDRVEPILALGNDKILIGGYFEQDIDFGNITKNSVGNYDAYLALISNPVVPVELTNFSLSSNKKQVNLKWSTSTETNNAGFEIQRSRDKINFKKIGYIKGAGSSTKMHDYSFADNSLSSSKYYYRLKQIDFDGSYKYSKIIEASISLPRKFALEQNYPNPFNPSTTIEYSVPKDRRINLSVFNVLGEKVDEIYSGFKKAGNYKINFNAEDLSSGVYFYRLKSGKKSITKKLILLQ